MSTVAYLSVAPEGRTDAGCILLVPEAVEGLRRLTGAIHDRGALAQAQIGHAGPVANASSNHARSLAPGRMFNPLGLRFTKAADEGDIARVTADVAAARQAFARHGAAHHLEQMAPADFGHFGPEHQALAIEWLHAQRPAGQSS